MLKEAAELIKKEKKGWLVDSSSEEMAELFAHLRDHPEEIQDAARQTIYYSNQHTWTSRAKQVAQELISIQKENVK